MLEHRFPRCLRLVRVPGEMEFPVPRPDEIIDLVRFLPGIRLILRLIRHDHNRRAALGAVMTQIADMIGTAQNPRIGFDFIEQAVDRHQRFIGRNTALSA